MTDNLKNAEQVTLRLQQVFEGILDGSIAHKEADAAVNAVGKMIGVAKLQIEQCAYRDEKPNVEWLICPPEGRAKK